jgi:hypothetical protein
MGFAKVLRKLHENFVETKVSEMFFTCFYFCLPKADIGFIPVYLVETL